MLWCTEDIVVHEDTFKMTHALHTVVLSTQVYTGSIPEPYRTLHFHTSVHIQLQRISSVANMF